MSLELIKKDLKRIEDDICTQRRLITNLKYEIRALPPFTLEEVIQQEIVSTKVALSKQESIKLYLEIYKRVLENNYLALLFNTLKEKMALKIDEYYGRKMGPKTRYKLMQELNQIMTEIDNGYRLSWKLDRKNRIEGIYMKEVETYKEFKIGHSLLWFCSYENRLYNLSHENYYFEYNYIENAERFSSIAAIKNEELKKMMIDANKKLDEFSGIENMVQIMNKIPSFYTCQYLSAARRV